MRIVAIVLASLLVLSAQPSLARALPPDPVAPRDVSECHRAYREFMVIREGVVEQAKAFGAQSLISRSPRREELTREMLRAYDEASRVLTAASEMRQRCFSQVRAFDHLMNAKLREFRRTEREGQAPHSSRAPHVSDSRPRGYIIRGDETPRSPLERGATNMAPIVRYAERLEEYLVGGPSDGFSRISRLADTGVDKIGSWAQWSQVQRALVRAALSEIININRTALSEFQGSIADFDAGAALAGLSARQEEIVNRRLLGANAPAPSGQPSSGASIEESLDFSRGRLVAMMNERQAAVDNALRNISRARAGAANPAPTRQSSRGSSSGNRSSSDCRNIQAQIRELQSVLSAYEAQGYGGVIRQGIRENQQVYNRRCR